eukprot:CAMPEP_0170508212 /NCGR_PEP_ID=MMETSP0208-20121228/61612_1 /TAXON_ID=197538 /ORGANISM="Strombidium inclinatum, Strain S3" /LENGTH=89 /DNA_ID=CAMNT_0010790973 /DNA_START=451 /DNA_END=720 /DNA_ORIENTATION=+
MRERLELTVSHLDLASRHQIGLLLFELKLELLSRIIEERPSDHRAVLVLQVYVKNLEPSSCSDHPVFLEQPHFDLPGGDGCAEILHWEV